ncbi:hypothetical protein BDN72DRAFT_813322 [Pluteus cervinus]|uniref:Uncharacterized protein n=1 Tax=Pluteus cervinus TaxID=181527 RepID=A0ACD3B8Z7_9AGAR|nr:hypothetical protein BDN72DRAFT_813322 [Pluteus cervinus]
MSFGGSSTFGSSLFASTQNQQQNQPATAGSTLFGGTTFGQPQQQQQQPATTGGGLFGQPAQQQQQQPATGGLFGGGTTTTQPGTGGLFGNTTTQPSTGGLFGNTTTTTQPAGALFGNTTTTTTQPSTGGLFGNNPAQPGATTGGSLFGQPAQQQQQQPAGTTGGSLFGGSTLFGGGTSSTGTGGFGFGQPQAQQQQQQPQQGLFGNTTGTANPLQPQATMPAFGNSMAGSTLFGTRTQSQQPQQQMQPGGFGSSTIAAPPGPPAFVKSTKFNDLPEDMKREFEAIESHIQGRAQISKELHQLKLGEEATKGQDLIKGMYKDLVNISTTIHNDLLHTKDLKRKVDKSVEDIIVGMGIIDACKNPQTGGHYLKGHAGFPLEYFTRVMEQMKERLAWYKSTIEQIERKLSTSTAPTPSPQAIVSTLQVQHTTFLSLAAKTAAIDAELQNVKAIYTQLWRLETGSVRDPFNEFDRVDGEGGPNGSGPNGDFGMANLNVGSGSFNGLNGSIGGRGLGASSTGSLGSSMFGGSFGK